MDATLGNKSYIYHFGYGYSKKRCKSITTWFIDRYLPRHKLTIDIVHRSLMKDDCYGYLDVTNYSRPRTFTISLHSKMKEIDYVKTLLHELINRFTSETCSITSIFKITSNLSSLSEISSTVE